MMPGGNGCANASRSRRKDERGEGRFGKAEEGGTSAPARTGDLLIHNQAL